MVSVGDYNGDGIKDVIFESTTGTLTEWQFAGSGDFSHTAFTLVTASPQYQIIATADLNNDLYDDLLWKDMSSGELTAWLFSGNGTLGSVTQQSHGFANQLDVVATGDFDNNAPDGTAYDMSDDLLWRNTVTGELQFELA